MRASIRDVGSLAGVSVGTVSNVLNRPDEVAPHTRLRVQRAIDELGYVPNRAARRLRGSVATTVGFVMMDGQNPFFTDVARGAEDEATRNGIATIFGNTDEDVDRERQYLDLFEAQQVRGLLIAPFGDVQTRLHKLAERGIRSVLIDRFSADPAFSSVSVDNVAGGRLAVEHLIQRGRTKIAVVGPFTLHQVSDRLAGARVAAENADAAIDLRAIATQGMSVEEGVASGRRLLAREPRYWPDAIFATNDLLALGILQALVTDGRIRIPDDIAIIGFDDIPFAGGAAVPLTSMRQPSRMIGRTAMRILLEETAEEDAVARHTVFQAELVVRASTAGHR